MGDIDARPLVGVSAGYTLGEAVLSGSWQFTRKDEDKAENGLATQQIHLNLSMPLFDLAGGVVSGSVSTDYGNRGYMQTWYGVSPEQAARTGFAEHKPKAGLVSAGVGLKWSHRVGRNGNWYISAEGTRLLGDAADSPIVQKATSSADERLPLLSERRAWPGILRRKRGAAARQRPVWITPWRTPGGRRRCRLRWYRR
jgi:outer membrane scaffolding protein for murein synthesis (MipA/OmpV family)